MYALLCKPVRFAAVLLCWSSLPGQVPYGYLAVVESSPDGESHVCCVDPGTGVRSELLGPDGAPRQARLLAVDPDEPSLLHVFEADASLRTAVLQGSRFLLPDPDATTVPAPAARIGGRGSQRWLCVPGGSLAGLWSAPAGGVPALLLPLSAASDLAVVGDMIYVSTYTPGLPSRIEELDLVSGQTRTVGSGYPPILSLGGFSGVSLMAGTPGGELLLVNRFTGQTSSAGNPGLGAITAIASDPVSGLPYLATDRNEVFLFGSFSHPVYVASDSIDDLDVGVHDESSWLFYGDGCPGTGGSVPRFVFVEAPTRGETFTIALSGGAPDAVAFLVAGFDRQVFAGTWDLPFPVSTFLPLVDGRCQVHTDIEVSAPASLDAVGQAQVVVNVPMQSNLVGLHTTWQWAILDPGAPGGLVTSEGAEAIVR